jgi:predicted TIM-barrel fold metal-dependent hydrolase
MERPGMMGIDVHAHYMPEPFLGLARRFSHISAAMLADDSTERVAARLRLMDTAGIRMQILSPPPTPYIETEEDAVLKARLSNDLMAELVQRHPARFAAYASLPLPHVEASLREMERTRNQHGMLGVTLLCACLGTSVADPRFEPLYAEMNRHETVLFLHPCVNGICSAMVNDYGLASSVGTSLEDALVVMHMIVERIPHRYPKIKMIVPHFGGPLAMLLNRLDNQLPADHPDLPEPPSVTARRFWFDTVGHGSRAALLCAHEAFGTERLVAGSDYPFLLAHETYSQTFAHLHAAGLSEKKVDQICRRNATALFGLEATSNSADA